MQQIICKTGCIQSVGGAIDSTAAQYLSLIHIYKALVERATRYITAAGSLLQDSMRVALSVSYTHLDVYKRQIIRIVFFISKCM